MLKIEYKNAEVKDYGYGLEVNGEKLEETISKSLGAKVGRDYNSGTTFSSNSCDVLVLIRPHKSVANITVDGGETTTVEDYIKKLEDKRNGIHEEVKETDAEE